MSSKLGGREIGTVSFKEEDEEIRKRIEAFSLKRKILREN